MEFNRQGKKFNFLSYFLVKEWGWMGLVEVVYGCLFSSNSCWGTITRLLKIWFALLDKVIRFCVSLWGGPDEGVLGHNQKYMYLYLFGDWRLGPGGFLISLMAIELIDQIDIWVNWCIFLFVLRLINGLFSTTFINPFVKIINIM